ncbi:CBO0543 family protein [Neobacillus sp. NRS-1170]|uniref:CBO0543 family protein n=1 Tax=Neobacillus sp. NRS-1170 TaxID=3233898 RepID=UPI003D2869B5
MFTFLIIMALVFVGWRWGDWKNWKKYQSTILYIITADLLYNFLCYKYSLWDYEPSIIFPNHTLANIFVMFVGYTSLILTYLGKFPTKRKNQILWISLWTLSLSLLELMDFKIFGGITYHNGWNPKWNFIFYFVMFSMLPLHNKKPLLAYGLSLIAIIVLLLIFKVPIWKMK